MKKQNNGFTKSYIMPKLRKHHVLIIAGRIFLNDIIQEYAKKDKVVDIVGIKTETRNLNFHNALTLIFVLNIYEPI